jgi:hypothetical protein
VQFGCLNEKDSRLQRHAVYKHPAQMELQCHCEYRIVWVVRIYKSTERI